MSSASGVSTNQFSSTQGVISPGCQLQTLSATATLSATQSGALMLIPNGAGRTITLPAAANCPGCKFRFVVSGATAGGIVAITSPSANVYPVLVTRPTSAAPVLSAGTVQTVVNVLAAAAVGTWVEFVSDGTNWYASGSGATDVASLSVA